MAKEYVLEDSPEATERGMQLRRRILDAWCPDRLVYFIVHTQGTEPASIFQQSLHHAAAPNPALALAFLRRTLFLFDSAFTDGFVKAVLDGHAAMDPAHPSNDTHNLFFRVLLRYYRVLDQAQAQAQGQGQGQGQGNSATAASIGRLILG